jgi:3-hydroxyisobutyrate dehydrogenase-like beta-hydroxyacid dehydrogenase
MATPMVTHDFFLLSEQKSFSSKSREVRMRVGFLGLGKMGTAMAANLLEGGHPIRVWNRSAAATARLAAAGAEAVATPAEAFDADVVFTMLADDAALREVLIDSGLLDRLAPPLIHVNMATISIAFAEELATRWNARGVAYVSAPVMGRPDAAAAARLNILAAGPEAAIAAVQPLLALLGQKTWRFGEQARLANVAKLAVNFTLAAAVETLAEATVLAEANGVPPRQLLDLLTGTLFPGPVHQGYGELIVERRYEPAGFKAALALKDLRLALAAADSASVPLPVGELVRAALMDAVAHQEGEMDLAVLGQVAARRAFNRH